MAVEAVPLVVALLAGLLLLGAGYLLRFQHAVAIVPLFNPESFADPRKTAETMGLIAFLLGAAVVVAGVLLFAL
jgi:hypothetical protein